MIKNINEILIHETVNEMLDLKNFVTLSIVIFPNELCISFFK